MSEQPGPKGGHVYDVVRGLVRRLQLRSLERRHDRTAVTGLFAFVNGLVSIGLLAALAWGTGQAFVFPSLGPTAFLLFYQPLSAASSPRNAVLGHLVGILAGYGSLAAFGLLDAGPTIEVGVSAARVGAAALSLAATSGFMVWLRVPHPPAGATTLIISLGILKDPVQLAFIEAAVVLLVAQAFVTNRLAGLDYPLWSPRGD